MAGACASSDAEEHATRGLDSSDVELELPSAVQDLIQRLELKADPLSQLPNLRRREFWDFFPERASLSTITGWQREVRLRVLESIGSCNTFRYLDIKDIFGGDISRLTTSEWELVLRGFRCSTDLRVIRVQKLTRTSLAELESFCLQVGSILKTSSVTDLTIGSCRLSAICLLNLASGLQGNSQSKLKSLELHNVWEMKHVAEIINSATRLETLEIGGSWDRKYDMDEEAAGILSQALIHSSSVIKLVLNKVTGAASAFLLKALDGDDGNRAIECLHLISVSGLRDCLPEILRSNRCLKEVMLTAIDMHPEKWRQLGQAIHENGTANTICVTHFMRHKFDLSAVEKLACAASSDLKDPIVELQITFKDYDALISTLNFVGRVFRGEVKSLISLNLVLVGPCPSGSNLDRMERIVPMDRKTRETSVLKKLKLYARTKDHLKAVWKYLLWCLRENTSLALLDLSNSELDEEAFRDLMGLLRVNFTLEEIDVSGTSWAKDGKVAQIEKALHQNRNHKARMLKIPYVTDDVGMQSPTSSYDGRCWPFHNTLRSGQEIPGWEDLKSGIQDFIPSFIREHERLAHMQLMYWENRRETSEFVGIRIQCQDGMTMSLTA